MAQRLWQAQGSFLFLFGLAFQVWAQAPTGPAVGQRFMVVSQHPLATAVGHQILAEGGNVFDAAVAIEFALAVVLPQAGNIGGGGFALYRKADGTLAVIDYRERAPLAATRTMYLDASGNPIPGASTEGVRASGVPGTVAGMTELHRKEGSLPWADVLAPAIALAEGFSLTAGDAEKLNWVRDSLVRHSRQTEGYVRSDGKLWQEGDTLRLPALAQTLRRIAESGRDGFYTGPVADALVAEMQTRGGLITHDDLRAYTPVWRTPLVGTYRGITIVSMPPPSSGGIGLLQLLGMVTRYPLAEWGPNSPRSIQLVAEASRRFFADRALYLGDPDHVKVPLDTLVSPDYLRRRMADYRSDRASNIDSIHPGSIPGYESSETTHYTVADAQGNALAVTTTLNGGFGAYVVVAGAGFILNNEMDDFAVAPGVPNSYGVVGGAANAIAPGKRPLSSMTPTLLLKGNQLFATLGSPGGSTIPTTVFQGVLNLVDYQMDAQAAVNAARFHHQGRPLDIRFERGGFSRTTLTSLEMLGYRIRETGPWSCMQIIRFRPDGTLEGGADARGNSAALGQ